MKLQKLLAMVRDKPVFPAPIGFPYIKYAARAEVKIAPRPSMRTLIHLLRSQDILAVRE